MRSSPSFCIQCTMFLISSRVICGLPKINSPRYSALENAHKNLLNFANLFLLRYIFVLVRFRKGIHYHLFQFAHITQIVINEISREKKNNVNLDENQKLSRHCTGWCGRSILISNTLFSVTRQSKNII